MRNTRAVCRSLGGYNPLNNKCVYSLISIIYLGNAPIFPSNIEWDLTNGPLSKLVELLDAQVFSGSVQ